MGVTTLFVVLVFIDIIYLHVRTYLSYLCYHLYCSIVKCVCVCVCVCAHVRVCVCMLVCVYACVHVQIENLLHILRVYSLIKTHSPVVTTAFGILHICMMSCVGDKFPPLLTSS